jgi:hypothetical protein
MKQSQFSANHVIPAYSSQYGNHRSEHISNTQMERPVSSPLPWQLFAQMLLSHIEFLANRFHSNGNGYEMNHEFAHSKCFEIIV